LIVFQLLVPVLLIISSAYFPWDNTNPSKFLLTSIPRK
jgi:hypothetical protein